MKQLFCSMYQVHVNCSEEERKQRCSICLEERKDKEGNCIHLSEVDLPDPFDVGDTVRVDRDFGSEIGGSAQTVLKVHRSQFSQSGWMVDITNYSRPLDSSWLTKI